MFWVLFKAPTKGREEGVLADKIREDFPEEEATKLKDGRGFTV